MKQPTTNTTRSNTVSKTQSEQSTVELSEASIKAEIGRRRNNKARKAAGEPVVRSKQWFMPALTKADFAALLDGAQVTKKYTSGRVVTLTLKTTSDA
jgi:hypothetical protein